MNLLKEIENTLHKTKVEKLSEIALNPIFSIKELINLTFHQDEQIGFRAAWILENVYTKYPECFLTGLDYFLERFSNQINSSARRHFSKIISLITCNKASKMVKDILYAFDLECVIETLFSWLIEDKVLVAVKVHCMQSLANLVPRYPWIKDELLQTIDYLTHKQSVAFFARAKQIKKQLKKV